MRWQVITEITFKIGFNAPAWDELENIIQGVTYPYSINDLLFKAINVAGEFLPILNFDKHINNMTEKF